jgi:alpha-tubulin suppressor-like RCC1 family protein
MGSPCPSGGEFVQVGLDANGDGILESGEVQQTAYVCNGASAETGATSCAAGALQCSGQQPQQCDEEGGWDSIGSSCDTMGQACVAGACVGVCSPGTTQCVGLGVETCASIGQWGPSTPCALTCGGGQCSEPAAISASGNFTCALLSGGVACWGFNEQGQLGNGSTADSSTPVAVEGLSGATAISVGAESACALVSGGDLLSNEVECWGYNGYGPLGDGTRANSSTPVTVVGLAGVATAVSVGTNNACALLSGGTVECWGYNGDGELGNGTTISSSTPVTVPGLSAVTAIAVGGVSSCALLASGTVECWGRGALGNGTTTSSSTPVAVSDLVGVTAISVGEGVACALLSGGTVECWGGGDSGQLGNGTTTSSSIPVAVSGLSGVTALSTSSPACALLRGGTVECWGNNRNGQLGDGTSTGPQLCNNDQYACSTTPVAVVW